MRRKRRNKKKSTKRKMMQINKVVEEWEIWYEEERQQIRERSKEVGTRMVPQVDQSLWQESK